MGTQPSSNYGPMAHYQSQLSEALQIQPEYDLVRTRLQSSSLEEEIEA